VRVVDSLSNDARHDKNHDQLALSTQILIIAGQIPAGVPKQVVPNRIAVQESRCGLNCKEQYRLPIAQSPEQSGYLQSLSAPWGNYTGATGDFGSTLAHKRMPELP
jgi:hypothetical protein